MVLELKELRCVSQVGHKLFNKKICSEKITPIKKNKYPGDYRCFCSQTSPQGVK